MRPLCLAEHEAQPESPSPTHLQETLYYCYVGIFSNTSPVPQRYFNSTTVCICRGHHNQQGLLSTAKVIITSTVGSVQENMLTEGAANK